MRNAEAQPGERMHLDVVFWGKQLWMPQLHGNGKICSIRHQNYFQMRRPIAAQIEFAKAPVPRPLDTGCFFFTVREGKFHVSLVIHAMIKKADD